jgi:uncharacterized protein YcfL
MVVALVVALVVAVGCRSHPRQKRRIHRDNLCDNLGRSVTSPNDKLIDCDTRKAAIFL